jgi:hypothetical protein
VNQCLKCNGARTVKGKIHSTEGAAVFRPEGLNFLALTLTGGTSFGSEAFACLDCGLVWSFTSPEKLRKFLRRHCHPVTR